jgi:tRNA pseudouridine32 synthase / 23S rRNA pseudouridine746 synthase
VETPSPIRNTPADPASKPGDDAHQALAPTLLHRDAMVLVIDKPAGLPVHPGPQARNQRIPTLIDFLDDLRFGLPRKPEAAHRLDKDTSGCLILGRHAKAIARLNLLFRQGRIGKSYWAVVEGSPDADSGVIDLPLGRKNPERGWWMEVQGNGLPSRTRWTVLGRSDADTGQPLAWLELVPETGRTHQLRVHMQAMGWPILGDSVYGPGSSARADGAACPMHLHARMLSVPMSASKPPLVVEAPPPLHMQVALAACGWAVASIPPAIDNPKI